jgi:hypothetical protein
MFDLETFATAFRGSAYNAYLNTLISGPPVIHEAYKRMSNPVVGDWVIETSTIYMKGHNLNGLGVLAEIANEPVDFNDPDFVWDEVEEGRPHPKERVYYINTLDGRRFRWTNASVIAILTEIRCGLTPSPAPTSLPTSSASPPTSLPGRG